MNRTKISILLKFALAMWILLFLAPIMYVNLYQMSSYGPAWNTPEPFLWEVLVVMIILGEILAFATVVEYARSR